MNRMRIALLGDFDTYVVRGLQRPAELLPYHLEPGLNLLRGLREIGARDVHIVIVTPEVKRVTVEEGPLGTVHRIPRVPLAGAASFFLGQRRAMWKELSEIQPEIAHGQGTEGSYAFTAVTSPYPNVATIHGIMHRIHRASPLPFFSLTHVPRWMEKIVVSRARDVVCISPEVRNFFVERGSAARCHLIPNAVTPCFFAAGESRRLVTEPVALFVGTISPLKDVLTLVEAAARARREWNVPVRLKLIGQRGAGAAGERYFRQVRARVEALGLTECVEFCGVRSAEDVATALKESAVLVLPSRQESAPMCVAEAMAAAVPVVATRVGGVPSLVDDNVTGVLVKAEQPSELARAMAAVLKNEALAHRLGEAGRAKALAHHTPRAVAEKTLAVYEEILRSRRPG
jgi:glycosyltransferase involved in cell wall biosynthesis